MFAPPRIDVELDNQSVDQRGKYTAQQYGHDQGLDGYADPIDRAEHPDQTTGQQPVCPSSDVGACGSSGIASQKNDDKKQTSLKEVVEIWSAY